jgi:hypothetical protein
METMQEDSSASTSLTEQKLREEIFQLRDVRRQTTLQLYVEVGKSILVFIAACLAFLLITRPDSLTNRTSSEDEMRRERARLVIELIKERDPEVVLAGLRAIRMSYPPADGEWIEQIEKEFIARSATVTQLLREREQLIQTRDELRRERVMEREGTAGTGIPGAGPVYRELEMKLKSIEEQIAALDRTLLLYRGR